MSCPSCCGPRRPAPRSRPGGRAARAGPSGSGLLSRPARCFARSINHSILRSAPRRRPWEIMRSRSPSSRDLPEDPLADAGRRRRRRRWGSVLGPSIWAWSWSAGGRGWRRIRCSAPASSGGLRAIASWTPSPRRRPPGPPAARRIPSASAHRRARPPRHPRPSPSAASASPCSCAMALDGVAAHGRGPGQALQAWSLLDPAAASRASGRPSLRSSSAARRTTRAQSTELGPRRAIAHAPGSTGAARTAAVPLRGAGMRPYATAPRSAGTRRSCTGSSEPGDERVDGCREFCSDRLGGGRRAGRPAPCA